MATNFFEKLKKYKGFRALVSKNHKNSEKSPEMYNIDDDF
jgi:hypothetical protein